MKSKMKNKVIAFAMSLAMVFTMMPMMGAPAYADDPAPAAPGIALGSDVLSVGSNTSGAATVHMAGTKWRVIGYGMSQEGGIPQVASSADTMTLIAADNLKTGVQFNPISNSVNTYKDSNLYNEVNALTDDTNGLFSKGEKEGIVPRDLEPGDYTGSSPYTNGIAGNKVENALLWPLSTQEAYYMDENLRAMNARWWLRSPGNDDGSAAFVYGDGVVSIIGDFVYNLVFNCGLRPAFDFNLESVLFTSAASGGKSSDSTGADALKAQSSETNSNNEWKVTIKDEAHAGFSLDKPCLSGYDNTTGVATVYYKGGQTGTGEYISAVIINSGGMVTYYGRIASASSATGSVTINTQGKLQSGDKLYVFNEQYHDDTTTDYASELKEIALASPTAHTLTETPSKVATCTEHGNSAYWTCSACGKYFSDAQGTTEIAENSWIISATGHSYGQPMYNWTKDGENWKCTATRVCGKDTSHKETETVTATGAVTRPATCTEVGTTIYTAKFLNEAFTEQTKDVDDIQATGHKYGAWTKLDATQHQRVCEHDATHVEKANHTWDAGKVTKPEKCTEKGEMTFTCTVEGCKATKTEEIRAKGHTEVVDKAVPATCTETGLTEGKHCSVCDEVLVKQETVQATGHKWDSGKVTKKATEKAEGIKTYTCTVCGETKNEAIPKLKPPAPKVSKQPSVKIKAGKKSLTLGWNKIKNAEGYDIFFARCNHSHKKIVCRKVKNIKGNNIFTWKKSGLKKGIAYKSYIKAYVYKDGKKKYVYKSPLMHAYTGNGNKKYTNAKGVSLKNVKKGKLTLKKGKTFKIKAKVNKVNKKKKLMPKSHAPTLRYMTSDKNIATVSKSGKITAKAKGKCTIYAYAHNGVCKKVTVTVKR